MSSLINNYYYLNYDNDLISVICQDFGLEINRPVLIIDNEYNQLAKLVIADNILLEFLEPGYLNNKELSKFADDILPDELEYEAYKISGLTILSWIKNNIKHNKF